MNKDQLDDLLSQMRQQERREGFNEGVEAVAGMLDQESALMRTIKSHDDAEQFLLLSEQARRLKKQEG